MWHLPTDKGKMAAMGKKRDSETSTNKEYPYVPPENIQKVNEFFTEFGIQYDQSSGIGREIQRPGINAPFKKFSLLKSDGYTFKISGKTHD